MILLTSLYRDPDAARQRELLECLRRNAKNDRLQQIHIFLEDSITAGELGPELASAGEKLRLVARERRATFQDLFAYASAELNGRRVIVANADIFFDETLGYVDAVDLAGKLVCLSRWDVRSDGSQSLFEHPFSQDAWIFRAPLPQFDCDFHLGLLACDNRLAWEARQAGLELCNPSRTIRANHLHLSEVRRYTEDERLEGPGKALPAITLGTTYPSALGPPPRAACASVVFSETMGFELGTLERGTSSHVNEPRPFASIPEELTGRPFTQVVAYSAAPVELEFLSDGKLYVLVANDWDGYFSVTSWLEARGYREDMPLLETGDGAGFEVWSVVGELGERFVLPTQAMLVAAELERR